MSEKLRVRVEDPWAKMPVEGAPNVSKVAANAIAAAILTQQPFWGRSRMRKSAAPLLHRAERAQAQFNELTGNIDSLDQKADLYSQGLQVASDVAFENFGVKRALRMPTDFASLEPEILSRLAPFMQIPEAIKGLVA